jgi:hypothetical protein
VWESLRTPIDRALAVRASLGLAGVATRADLEAAVAAAGLDLDADAPLQGNVYGLLDGDTIALKRRLWPSMALVVLAHELGHHHLGHVGAPAALRAEVAAGMGRADAGGELDAAVFGWTLIVGAPARTLDGLTKQVHAAHAGGVPTDICFQMTAVLIAPPGD